MHILLRKYCYFFIGDCMYNLIYYFWNFVIGSFFGFLCETVWCFIKLGHFESRKGLIYGFFIPIYGIATVIISLFVSILDIHSIFLFLVITFFICAVVEYFSSYFQEKCFATKSWDYSEMKLYLHGSINFVYLLAWSFLGIFWCKYSYDLITFFLAFLIKIDMLYIFTFIFFVYMLFNVFISCAASYRQKLRRNGKQANNWFDSFLDKKYNDDRLKKVYSNAIFINK